MPLLTSPPGQIRSDGARLRRVSADLRHFTKAADIRSMEKELLREMSRTEAKRIIRQAKVDAGWHDV